MANWWIGTEHKATVTLKNPTGMPQTYGIDCVLVGPVTVTGHGDITIPAGGTAGMEFLMSVPQVGRYASKFQGRDPLGNLLADFPFENVDAWGKALEIIGGGWAT